MLVRYIAVFYVIGCALALAAQWRVAVLIICGLLIACFFLQISHSVRQRIFAGICALCIAFLWTSYVDSSNQTMIEQPIYSTSTSSESFQQLSGKIASLVKRDGDRVSFVLSTPADSWFNKERIQVFVTLQSEAELEQMDKLKRTSEVTMRGTLERPQKARNFGAFDYREYLKKEKIHWIFEVEGIDRIGIHSSPHFWHPAHLMEELRSWLAGKVERMYSPEHTGLMKSMLLGLRDELLPGQYEAFSKIGMTHILAISGLHIGVFVAGLIFVLRQFRMAKETYLSTAIAIIPLYIGLTGAAPSVVRAGLMGMLGLYALKKGWLKNGLNIVCIVAVLMLLWNPYYLINVSYQLSFIVTTGLIVGVPRLNKLFARIPWLWLRSLISVTIAAQLFSFPLVIYYFNQYSLLSGITNLLLVPIVSLIILPVSLVALCISLIHEPSAAVIIWIIEPMIFLLLEAIQYASEMRFAYMIWASPTMLWLLGYYGCLGLLWIVWDYFHRTSSLQIQMPLRQRKPLAVSSLLLLLFSGVVLQYYSVTVDESWRPAKGKVSMIDVGQGDAILIETPGGKHVLIDGGGHFKLSQNGESWRQRRDPFEVGKDVLVPLLKKRGVHRLDAVIISHHDYDHAGGLLAVLKDVPVKEIWMNGSWKGSSWMEELYAEVLRQNIPVYSISKGQSMEVDRDTEMSVIYPFVQNTSNSTVVWEESQNEQSIVIWMRMYESTFLFTGDVYAQQEQLIIDQLQRMAHRLEDPIHHPSHSIDVMKVAHHGSKTSSSVKWLEFWRPRVSVISAGRNNWYGHPHPDVVERLRRLNGDIHRTDQQGEVQFQVSPDHLKVRTKIEPEL